MINMQKLIDEAVAANGKYKGGFRDGAKFHVSDAGTCYRKRFIKRFGVPSTKEIPLPNQRKMVAGDAGHEKLQSLLTKYHKLFASEGEIETEHVKGHYDGIIKHEGRKAMWELKTIEKWGMTHITKDGAKPEHVIQMFTYWAWSRPDYKDLDEAVLTYAKREDFGAKDFHYDWSDEIQKQVDDEWNPLIGYWERMEIPPCTCAEDYNGSGIAYCPFPTGEGDCCSEKLVTLLVGEKLMERDRLKDVY